MFLKHRCLVYDHIKVLMTLNYYWIIALLIRQATSHQQDTIEQGTHKNPSWNNTYTDLLKRDLLAHYDKFARPAQHTNVTKVDLDLVFKHIELDDTKSLLTVNAWVRMMWGDEKLVWNESDYGGLSKLHVADHEVWEPDILLYNSATGNNIDHYGNTHLLVYSDGTVLWVPPSQFSVFCEMDLTKWPFDRHTCNLVLASWTYGGDMVDLTTNTSKLVDVEIGSYHWKVVYIKRKRNEKYYTCCAEPYIDIVYSITIERASAAYKVIVFAPAIGVMILCLSIFWIPANSSSKFIVASTTVLAQTLFLIYLLQRLVTLGAKTPLIILFYAYGIVMVGVSMIVSLITYNMATKHNPKPVPWSLVNIINSKMTSFLFLPKYQSWSSHERIGEELTERSTLDEDREDLTTLGSICKRPVTAEWFIVATAIDRLVFYIYLVFFLCFGIRCLL